jgi:hypothetical protein
MNAAQTKAAIITAENAATAIAEQIELMRHLGDEECLAILRDKYTTAMKRLAELRAAR